ncbi:unnamed protein product [Cylindrotheca closterium]|uniref:Rubisco LSMT substrate-binding domain-containing protein n=1 Tax=Cylindrotheca closterium TaxID=2856 RepID=A0AAD2FKX0_9STRA|nr:unnamed protein product [Cylindrotheca closterium]
MLDHKIVPFHSLLIALSLLVSPNLTAAFQFRLPPPPGAVTSSNLQQDHTLHNTALYAASSRQKRVSSLQEWGKSNDIQTRGVAIESIPGSGLGLQSTQEITAGSLVVTVPSSATLSVTSGSLGGPDDFTVESMFNDRKSFRVLPWYAQFSLYLHKLNTISSVKADDTDLKPWLDSLPTTFDTPIRWDKKQRDEWLQYQHMSESVDRQQEAWTDFYQKVNAALDGTISWDDFLLGCEIARSRAFSGGYTGTIFNPLIYAFTLVLVTVYAGLGLGTLEQAANGAALVFCASVLRDFVIPKLFKTKKYVICPIIDMANHKSAGATANVAYEFFSDAYSLSATPAISTGNEIFISYGERSNDQLLQYYGFVEPNNPNDIYVMPPIREWDIGALEESLGTPFAPGRLGKLERAGLLGKTALEVQADKISEDSSRETTSDDTEDANGNPRGGVVLTRAAGIDLAVLQALRALVSTEAEWQESGEAVGNFAAMVSTENEERARLVARTALEMELQAKPTTLEEDEELLKRSSSSSSSIMEDEERLAVSFRIEKKKILKDSIARLK